MSQINPIKSFREAQTPAMSQAELARLLNVSRFTVLRWERDGKPDRDKLPKITEVTGIPAKELRPDLVEKHEEIFGGAQ